MSKNLKCIYINNVFNNTINEITKKLEACNYRLWCLQRQINLEFNKPNFNGKRFIKLCLLVLLNKVRFVNKFHELCNDARNRIRSLINK